jgi:hypothetical protein
MVVVTEEEEEAVEGTWRRAWRTSLAKEKFEKNVN